MKTKIEGNKTTSEQCQTSHDDRVQWSGDDDDGDIDK